MDQAKQSQEELDDVDKSSYPLDVVPSVSYCQIHPESADDEIEISKASPNLDGEFDLSRSHRYSATPSIPSTTMSKRSHGVLDWNQPGGGQSSWERTLWYVTPFRAIADSQEKARSRRYGSSARE